MTQRLLAVASAPCWPTAGLLIEDQRGAPSPLTRPACSPRAAKRSDLLAVGTLHAWRWLVAELWSAVNSDAMHGIAASLFGAWLHGKAALDRFFITWFKGPVAWPPLHLMHAASGLGVVLCCFGRVYVQDEGANPSNERLAARLYRTCGPDTAEKSVTRVILKPATPLLLSCP